MAVSDRTLVKLLTDWRSRFPDKWIGKLDSITLIFVLASSKVTVRNLLICVGIYYLSRWVALPLAFAFGKLTQGRIYHGDFQSDFVAPLILHLHIALIAALVGALVIWLVDSSRPLLWSMFLALLYVVFGFFGYHWAHTPTLGDRVFEIVGAVFPGVTCLIGGIIASRLRRRAHTPPIPS